MTWRNSRCGLASVVLLSAAGCKVAVPQQTELMEEVGITVRRSELRTRIHDFAPRFSGLVEEAGTEILREEQDPELRHWLRYWMTHSIPVAYRAMFQPDPLAALVDTWVLCGQMRACVDEGPAGERFGIWSPLFLATCVRLEGEIEEIARKVFTEEGFGEAQALVAQWVVEHPIGETTWVRESTIPLTADVTGNRDQGALEAVATLAESADAMRSELNLYTRLLPRQARWLADDFFEARELDQTLADVTVIASSLQSLDVIAKDVPRLISEELTRALEWAHEERLEVLRSVEAMLTSTIREIEDERGIIIRTLSEERIIVLEEIQRQREAILREARQLVEQVIDDSTEHGEELVDRFFLRTAQLGAIAVLLGAIALVWTVRRLAPRSGESRAN